MVTVNYKQKQGEMVMDGNIWDIYAGNCLFVALMRHNNETDGGEIEYWNMPLFFGDETHMKKCFGITKNGGGKKENLFENAIEKITLYRNNWTPADLRKVVGILATASGKINIEVRDEE